MATTLCLLSGRIFAQKSPPSVPLIDNQYHTSWTVRDGVPAGIWQVKQTTDGFLWFATENGLYRFDGISFLKYQAPSGQKLLNDGPVTALTPTADGGLWIAYRYGGASLLRGDVVTNYPANKSLSQTIFVLAQDKDGFVWGATPIGLVHFDGKRWSRVDETWGQRIAAVDHLRLDLDGNLWVDDGKSYYVLPRGTNHFQATGLPNGKIYISGLNTGWLTRDDVGLFSVHRSPAGVWTVGPQVMKENISSITQTIDGSLWFGAHDGIWRIRRLNAESASNLPANAVQTFRKADGMTGDFVYALTVDREGSIWAITPNGLDQFRNTVFTSVDLPPDMQHPFLLDEGKSVLIASGFHAKAMLVRVSATGIETISTPFLAIREMYRDASGMDWINADGKLWQLVGSKLIPVTGPQDIQLGKLKIRSMTMDKSGTLWISVTANGPDKVYRLSQGVWTLFDEPEKFLSSSVTAMMTDGAGSIWMGSGTSQISIIDASGIRSFDRKQGVDSGGITLMKAYGDHVWIGGTENLDYYTDGKFRRVACADGSSILGVTGITETANGDVWLNGSRGVSKIEASEMRQALLTPAPMVHTRVFNYLDGYPAAPIVRLQSSTMAQTADGRLYILGRQGLVWVDPANIGKNDIPPNVSVTSTTVDQHTYENPSDRDLPQGARNLQIDYTATSLLVPGRVHFRYKLQNFDKEWQEVGTRRQAFYTGLPPGRYTFLVMASNNDGVWSKLPASLAFLLPPTFLQSIWFKLLCFVSLILALTALYLFRVKLLTAEIQNRLFERLAERERIARDLHDTFFQGIQGLFLRFNTGTSLLPPDEPAKKIFTEALERSDRVMAEGRELVLDLRAEEAVAGDLAEGLARMGEQSAGPDKPDYKVVAVGQAQKLHPVCATELLRIGREAIYNAFLHSNAEAIEVEVIYEKEFFKMRVRDDGQGIDENVVRDGRRPGHMGLVGMSERAQSIGARYSIWSKKGQGTEIEVEVPAAIAYAPVREAKVGWISQSARIRRT